MTENLKNLITEEVHELSTKIINISKESLGLSHLEDDQEAVLKNTKFPPEKKDLAPKKEQDLQLFIQNIRYVRDMEKVSQKKLAKSIGVAFQQLHKYENGTNQIPLDYVITIAKYLGYEGERLSYFLFEDFKERLDDMNYELKASKGQRDFFMEAINCFTSGGYKGLAKFFEELRKRERKLTYKKIASCIGVAQQICHKDFKGGKFIPLKRFVKLLNYFYFKKYLDN